MKQYGLIAGAVLIFLGGTLQLLNSAQTSWAPFTLFNTASALIVGSTPINNPDLPFRTFWLSAISSLPMTLVYLAWSNIPVNQLLIPKRSFVLLVLVIGFSLLWFIYFGDFRIGWQGFRDTMTFALINIVFAILAAVVLLKHKSKPSPYDSLVFHTTLFVWLTLFAFPLLGLFPL